MPGKRLTQSVVTSDVANTLPGFCLVSPSKSVPVAHDSSDSTTLLAVVLLGASRSYVWMQKSVQKRGIEQHKTFKDRLRETNGES